MTGLFGLNGTCDNDTGKGYCGDQTFLHRRWSLPPCKLIVWRLERCITNCWTPIMNSRNRDCHRKKKKYPLPIYFLDSPTENIQTYFEFMKVFFSIVIILLPLLQKPTFPTNRIYQMFFYIFILFFWCDERNNICTRVRFLETYIWNIYEYLYFNEIWPNMWRYRSSSVSVIWFRSKKAEFIYGHQIRTWKRTLLLWVVV